jgi:hypothetical protein
VIAQLDLLTAKASLGRVIDLRSSAGSRSQGRTIPAKAKFDQDAAINIHSTRPNRSTQ